MTKRWYILAVAGLLFLAGAAWLAWAEGPLPVILAGTGMALFIAGMVFWVIGRHERRVEAEAEQEKLRIKAQADAAQFNIERAEAEARRIEWEKTHGRLSTKVVGVTYKNDDGSSRQRALRNALDENCAGDVSLEAYEYHGAPAVKVFYNGRQIGHIPAERAPEVVDIMPRLEKALLEVGYFRPDDDDEDGGRPRKIFYASLTLIYRK